MAETQFDFQCPYCQALTTVIFVRRDNLVEEGREVRAIYRTLPPGGSCASCQYLLVAVADEEVMDIRQPMLVLTRKMARRLARDILEVLGDFDGKEVDDVLV